MSRWGSWRGWSGPRRRSPRAAGSGWWRGRANVEHGGSSTRDLHGIGWGDARLGARLGVPLHGTPRVKSGRAWGGPVRCARAPPSVGGVNLPTVPRFLGTDDAPETLYWLGTVERAGRSA